MAACCRSNLAGGGGGAVLATTARFTMAAGGLTVAGRPPPRTACLVGAVAGAEKATGARTISRSFTRTTLLCTDCPLVKVCREVAVTALGAPWFTYLTLVTFLLTTTLV